MEHDLDTAYEPVGGHGMSLRRACKRCGEVFSVDSPNEVPPLAKTKCVCKKSEKTAASLDTVNDKFFMGIDRGYALGFYEAGDKIIAWLNSLDSSEMSVADFRSHLYHFIMELRPDSDPRRYFTKEKD